MRIYAGLEAPDVLGRNITYAIIAVVRLIPNQQPAGNKAGVSHFGVGGAAGLSVGGTIGVF